VIPRVNESLVGKIIKNTTYDLPMVPELGKPVCLENKKLGLDLLLENNKTHEESKELLNEITEELDRKVSMNELTESIIKPEELSCKSNSELRKIVKKLYTDVSEKTLKKTKKADLIKLIMENYNN
jgi:hypothetical protein